MHDSFERFTKEMQCHECGDMIEWCGDEGVKWFLEGLRDEMDGWCAWEVDERCVERWNGGFEKMVPLLRGRQVRGCWLLEQEEVQVEDGGVEDEIGENDSMDLGGEEEVEECSIEGLEVLRLMGGQGFTADGFVRFDSPLWGSMVDESLNRDDIGEGSLGGDPGDQRSVNGEREGSFVCQELTDEEEEITATAEPKEVQVSPSSLSLDVKGPATTNGEQTDQFILDMLDAFSEYGREQSTTNDIDDAHQRNEVDGESISLVDSIIDADSGDSDNTSSLFASAEDLWPNDDMEIEGFIDSSPERVTSEQNPHYEASEDVQIEAGGDIPDIKEPSGEAEGTSIESCEFQDHQKFPLGDSMEVEEFHDSVWGRSDNGENTEEDMNSESSADDLMEDEIDGFEVVERGESDEEDEREHDVEDHSDVVIGDGMEVLGSRDGDATDEESDEASDYSDLNQDMQMSEDAEVIRYHAEAGMSDKDDYDSNSPQDIMTEDPDQVPAFVEPELETGNFDDGYSEYESDVEQIVLIGYGAQFQGVREYRSDESEESEED